MGKIEILGYYNGNFGSIDEITVPINDRAGYFGDGVYDASACYNRKIFALDEHIDRFFNSAKLLEIDLPYSKEWLKNELYRMVEEVESENQFVYWQASRGTALRSHAFPETKPNLWIMITPFRLPDLTKRYSLITYKDLRYEYCNIKTLNLIPSVLATEAAKKVGADEAIFYREGDVVTECAHSNISILKDGTLYTHPADNLILSGIARKHLIGQAVRLGIPVREEAFYLKDIYTADEVIVTNSGSFFTAVSSVEGKEVGGKATELIEKLKNALLEEYVQETGLVWK